MRLTAATILTALVLPAPAAAQISRYNAIWGISANDVWAVGNSGVAAHFTGQGWMNTPTGATKDLRDVWASGPRDVWAVGDDATILRMTGTAWTWVRPPVNRHFIAVRGCGPNDVWVLGQSISNNDPAALLHFNGTSWTVENTPFPVRPAGLTLTCTGVAGSGGGGMLTVAGSVFFDPSPQQRRTAGALLKRAGGSWTSQGYNGRAVDDTLLGGAAWTTLVGAGSTTLLVGQVENGGSRMLLSRGSGWTNLAAPVVPDVDASDFRFTLAGDGTPIALFDKGLARYTGGRWAVTAAGEVTLGMSAAEQAEYMQLGQTMAQGRLTQQQMQRFQELATKMQSAGMNMAAAATRSSALNFGREPAAYAATGASVLVASANLDIMRVTGDSSEIVWSAKCNMAEWMQLEPCSTHAARGTPPTPASGPQPEPPPEAPPAAAPAAAPSAAPRMPSVPRPRIPRP